MYTILSTWSDPGHVCVILVLEDDLSSYLKFYLITVSGSVPLAYPNTISKTQIFFLALSKFSIILAAAILSSVAPVTVPFGF